MNPKVPYWIVQKRAQICASCNEKTNCVEKFNLVRDSIKCPLNKFKSVSDEIAERAWPSGMDRVSGCCDSALNYGE